jgi:prophage regulatory protein
MTTISIPTAQPVASNDFGLLRLPAVLQAFPVSRSGWLEGVRTGKFPQPVRIGTRCVAWRSADIRNLIASL